MGGNLFVLNTGGTSADIIRICTQDLLGYETPKNRQIFSFSIQSSCWDNFWSPFFLLSDFLGAEFSLDLITQNGLLDSGYGNILPLKGHFPSILSP